MPINIEIYERTGSAGSPTDTLVTNMNWKSQSLPDTLYKYYYYPIRQPMGGDMISCSVPKFIYAKISGTYSSAKRVRWNISVEGGLDPGSLVTMGTTSVYTTPQPVFNGSMSPFQEGTVIPKLSTTGPTSSPVLTPTLAGNQTYYTDFFVTQFMLTNLAQAVGNSNVFSVELILDEYE